ncbi:hypothetical protein NE865_10938 [Phthorimaea operculella]|nr:hypothetical protein NE865_10938 [Phthorimaea operculella]
MNKLLIVLLAVCLVSVHAYVKRDAPEAAKDSNMLDDLQKSFASAFEEAKKNLDPEKLKVQFDEAVKKGQALFESLNKPAEAKP